MAAIDDLNKSVADVATAVGRVGGDISGVATDVATVVAILKNPNSTDAQIAAAATALEGSVSTMNTSADALEAAKTSLEAALPAPPAPTA